MAIDDSFKKPGAIPFKWEIRPGVPRSTSPSHHLGPSFLQQNQIRNNHNHSSHSKFELKPPPARSGHDRVDPPNIGRPEVVEFGCFANGMLLKRKNDKKKIVISKPRLDAETLSSKWSESTRMSFSQFRDVPLSPSYSSYQSSPCLFSDPEWVGFGLF